MRFPDLKRGIVPPFLVLAVALSAAFAASPARPDEWVFYAASFAGDDPGRTLRDWYVLNKLKPVPEAEGQVSHYYDRESIGGNRDFPGGIFRVWEKYVLNAETKSYEDARAEVERVEERKLRRKLTALDYGWLFPLAVNRATKEVRTLFEINCDSREFIILEINHYDRDGNRMSRETNMNMELWYRVEPGSVMEAFFKLICSDGDRSATSTRARAGSGRS